MFSTTTTCAAGAAARSSQQLRFAKALLQQRRFVSKDIRFGSDARMQMLSGKYRRHSPVLAREVGVSSLSLLLRLTT